MDDQEQERRKIIQGKKRLLNWFIQKHEDVLNHLSYIEKLSNAIDYDPFHKQTTITSPLEVPSHWKDMMEIDQVKEELQEDKLCIRYPLQERQLVPKVEWSNQDRFQFFLHLKYFPLHQYMREAQKVLCTKDWNVAREEMRCYRVMEKIEELKEKNLWSSRQLKKHQTSIRRRTHWDFLLEEMEWMSVDFAEERKWKRTMAYSFAHQVENSQPITEEKIEIEINDYDDESSAVYGPPDTEMNLAASESINELTIVPVMKWKQQNFKVETPLLDHRVPLFIEQPVIRTSELFSSSAALNSEEECLEEEKEQPKAPSITINDMEWNAEEDNILLSIATEYQMNWALICDLVNGCRNTKPKTPEECSARYSMLENIDSYDMKMRKDPFMRAKLMKQEFKKRQTRVINLFENIKKAATKARASKKDTQKKVSLAAHPSHDAAAKKANWTKIVTPTELAIRKMQKQRPDAHPGLLLRPNSATLATNRPNGTTPNMTPNISTPGNMIPNLNTPMSANMAATMAVNMSNMAASMSSMSSSMTPNMNSSGTPNSQSSMANTLINSSRVSTISPPTKEQNAINFIQQRNALLSRGYLFGPAGQLLPNPKIDQFPSVKVPAATPSPPKAPILSKPPTKKGKKK